MDAPGIPCRVYVDCQVSPSEDPRKVRHALTNIFPGMDFEEKSRRMHGTATGLGCLNHLCEEIRNRQHRKSLGRQIRLNARDGSFWFYLNKQAAFANVAALCEHDDESPLGPIKVSVMSGRIGDVSGWLVRA